MYKKNDLQKVPKSTNQSSLGPKISCISFRLQFFQRKNERRKMFGAQTDSLGLFRICRGGPAHIFGPTGTQKVLPGAQKGSLELTKNGRGLKRAYWGSKVLIWVNWGSE